MILDSHGGALYRRQVMKAAEKRFPLHKDLTGYVLQTMRSPLFGSMILKSEWKEKAAKSVDAALTIYFDALPATFTAGDKIDLLYFQQICALKYAISTHVLTNFIAMRHPLLSVPLFDLVQKISGKSRVEQEIYRFIIQQNCPKLKQFSLDPK